MKKQIPGKRDYANRKVRMGHSIFVLLALGSLAQAAAGFEVIKNINSGKPPVEKIVIFEKGKPADHLVFIDDADCKLSFTADGSIECRLLGTAEVKPMIKWKAKAGLPAGFRLQDYNYVILTCRLEGSFKVTDAKGKVADRRPSNSYFGFHFYDAEGVRQGVASLADGTATQIDPDKTTVLKYPMTVVRCWDGDKNGEVQAIGFPWGKKNPDTQRDYRLVIEKIALAVDAPN